MPSPGLRASIFAAALCIVAAALGGCAAPVALSTFGITAFRAGGSAYLTGELESAEVTEMHALFQIVQDVLVQDLGMPITIARAGNNHAYIHTRESQGRKIRITLERKSPIVTKINIRIGMIGDQPVSRLILQAIQARTPAPPRRRPDIEDLLRELNGDVLQRVEE